MRISLVFTILFLPIIAFCQKNTDDGDLLFQQGDYVEAAQFYHDLMSDILVDFNTKSTSAQPNKKQLELCSQKANLLHALEQKGEALTASKQTGIALQTFMTADRLVDIMRVSYFEADFNMSWKEKTRILYEKALDLTFQTKNTKKAFYFFEKSKSISLLDVLNKREKKQLLPDSLIARELELLQNSNAARKAASKDKTQHPNYVQTNKDLEKFQADLAKNYPRYYAIRYATSVADLEENDVVYSRAKETEYVHFFYGKKHIYSMRFGTKKHRLTRTIRTDKTDILIEKYLHQFSSPDIITDNPEKYSDLAFQVYELLLKPLFPTRKFPKELVLLPDDLLHSVPFDALKNQSSSTNNADYLLQQTNMRYAYSINILKNKQYTDNQKVIIVNPDLKNLNTLKLEDDLIVLSSYDKELKESELVLNRDSIYTDSKGVLSILWRLNTQSTSDILTKFYAHLNQNTTKSEALYLAKKDFLQQQDSLFQFPYYWAGLTYSGTDGTVVLEHNSSWKFLLLSGGILVILSLLFLRKKIKK